MARKDQIMDAKNLENLKQKSSSVAYGLDTQLDDESVELRNIIQQTIIETRRKIGERTNEKPINYFNELNFGKAFSEVFIDKEKGAPKEDNEKKIQNFKQYMNDNDKVDIGSLLMENGTRSLMFNNFRIIHKHIPECAQALNIYKDNIMSPDDYTKLIFNVNYEKALNEDLQKEVNQQLDGITLKYELEDKADEIIEEALMLGESYTAVLSIENELHRMLGDPSFKNTGSMLNEDMAVLSDKNAVDHPVLSESLSFTQEELSTLNEALLSTQEIKEELEEAKLQQFVASLVNENVKIGSSRELLLEKYEADYDANKDKPGSDIGKDFYQNNDSSKKSKKKARDDGKPMYVNGSAVRRLDPDKVVELRIDNICYGYYYAEEVQNNLPKNSYLGMASGRNASGAMALSQNSTISGTTNTAYSPMTSAAAQLNVGEAKLRVISDMFLKAISKKIDKDFVRKNKEFKDFIYDLVRQDYIIRKGVKLTYFLPEEIIKFECDPIYKDITFFAKLYLSILTNNLLIKLGRAHDKRVFYVNVGADAAYEQAIQTVIQDIKTKDYKMEQLNDFNTVLNLTPGRFDDYYMPSVNGERPVEIETLPGMDVDMNNEFVEYLKNSMMSGMGVPRNLIDVTSDVDYARSISAMNANFVRSVIRYQKKLTPSFTRMYQKLYENEYKYNNDKENEVTMVDLNSIKVQFPSPATLAMSNISDQVQAAEQNADFIATQIVPIKQDGSTEDLRIRLKSMIVKDLLPSIDWERYEEFVDKVKLDIEKENIELKANPAPDDGMMGGDPYGGGMY